LNRRKEFAVMTIASSIPDPSSDASESDFVLRRPLGTMIAYGFAPIALEAELELARWLGASVLEILPDWRALAGPEPLREQVASAGLTIHSAHGCWGGQTIRAPRVDLGAPEPAVQQASVEDLKRCVDWLAAAGGTCLVVHPGGLSEASDAPARRDALARGLLALAEHAQGSPVLLCVENMPPGVHPGSRMADHFELVAELRRPELALALDTGHAHIAATAGSETRAAAGLLRTTHVHDNNGRQDSHLPPGLGTIDWTAWLSALDAIDYRGPIVLECIRYLRNHPDSRGDGLSALLRQLTRSSH
jgi:sugar phosphate isomerase/epimerase